MESSNFSQRDLNGKNKLYQETVDYLKEHYGLDFVALGLTAYMGAPLKWIYGAGATNERFRRIVLSPGHGIGGIVIKSGKPMMFLDIDKQIDPREYSSYPIVFAEDLRSFCALPLLKENRVVGSLLCAYRSVNPEHEQVYHRMIDDLQGKLCGLTVVSEGFLYFDSGFVEKETEAKPERTVSSTSIEQVIMAQEDERRRISRELHDGIAQEILSVSFLIRQLGPKLDDTSSRKVFTEVQSKIDSIIGELHNLSVELRPSTLDHLGLIPALRSQSIIFEKNYGAEVILKGKLSHKRFNRALETQVYRICQEAILNACKYSGADVVVVEIADREGQLYATITDEGQGFNTVHPDIKGSGCGLTGIQERAHLIDATLKIESDDSGTVISLIAPFVLEEKD